MEVKACLERLWASTFKVLYSWLKMHDIKIPYLVYYSVVAHRSATPDSINDHLTIVCTEILWIYRSSTKAKSSLLAKISRVVGSSIFWNTIDDARRKNHAMSRHTTPTAPKPSFLSTITSTLILACSSGGDIHRLVHCTWIEPLEIDGLWRICGSNKYHLWRQTVLWRIYVLDEYDDMQYRIGKVCEKSLRV